MKRSIRLGRAMKRSLLRIGLVAAAVAAGLGFWLQRGLRAHAAPHLPTPRLTLGAYASPRTVADGARWLAFLQRADTTALNTVVLDLVSPAGVHFPSHDHLAARIAAPPRASYDLGARVAEAHAHHLFVIGRIDVARNPRLARARPRWAIRTPAGRRWTDAAGRGAIDATNEDACEFLGHIAAEAARAGIDEVMLDDIEIPAAPGRPRVLAAGAGDRPVHQAVTRCARTVAGSIRRARARLGITVPGSLCFDVARAGRNGQRWEDLALVADRLSPTIYPHTVRTPAGGRMSGQPYQAVSTVAAMCYTRTMRLIRQQNGAPVRVARLEPWIQAYAAGGAAFGPNALREELRALREHGVGNALLWSGDGDYDRFVPALRQPLPGQVVAYNPTAAEWARASRAPEPERP